MTVRTTHTLPSALDPDQLCQWLGAATSDAATVFLDYDGTLTPIVDRPEQATLAVSTRDRLVRLSERGPVTIVTGRDISIVRKFVQLDQLGYAGCHGLDIEGPVGSGLRYEVAAGLLPVLDDAEADLRRRLDGIAGAIVERKRYSLSTHYRLVGPGDASRVDAAVREVGHGHPQLRREGGKKVFELRPDVEWDKGSAVAWMLEATSRPSGAATYIGDDQTDEHAFELLSGRGVPIVVAHDDRPTAARYRVRNPDEVMQVLDRILDALVHATSPRRVTQI